MKIFAGDESQPLWVTADPGHRLGLRLDPRVTTKKRPLFDVLKSLSKKPRQNFLTWQRLERQKSSL
jgi:hypothetical protein